MQRRAARRWLAVTGISAALVVPFSVSASAEPAPTVGVVLLDTLFAPGSPGTLTAAGVLTDEPGTLHNFTLTYDTSGISGFADVAVYDDSICEQSGAKIKCVIDEYAFDLFGGEIPPIAIAPKAGAVAGDEGDLKLTVSSDETAAVSDTAKVSVGEGVDLAAEDAPDLSTTPGGSYSELLGVQNVGKVTAHGAVLMVDSDFGIEAGATRYSNCLYDGDQLRLCEFDTDLAPGKSYGATLPFKMRSDTPAPGNQFVSFSWATPGEWGIEKALFAKLGLEDILGEPGTGPKLSLAEKEKGDLQPIELEFARKSVKSLVKQTDEQPWDNWTDSTITVNGKNSADVAAVGDQASASLGQFAEVDLGTKNNGPASIWLSRSGDLPYEVVFTVPPGAAVTEAPFNCAPVGASGEPDWEKAGEPLGAKYVCEPDPDLPAGEQVLNHFRLKITQEIPDAKGKVEVVSTQDRGLPATIDGDPSNNVAYVVLNGKAPASPVPSPSAGDHNGGLPVTGTPVVVIAVVGLFLAGAGYVLFRVARRRRLTEV